MKLTVDRGACQGHARCVTLDSTLFALDDEDLAVVLVPEVSGAQLSRARAAENACPEGAIRIQGDDA
ncbi:ferredoxin [Sporichthya sp.]|uniref:ferredoxin n=1 Tax=Sporichthya sp. TaxID=65475 RepID=UPI0017B88A2A|nr:ferredoxin [Sporichthya sp.]MBA3741357.1 ferredoxin [Sporichthya sp.]